MNDTDNDVDMARYGRNRLHCLRRRCCRQHCRCRLFISIVCIIFNFRIVYGFPPIVLNIETLNFCSLFHRIAYFAWFFFSVQFYLVIEWLRRHSSTLWCTILLSPSLSIGYSSYSDAFMMLTHQKQHQMRLFSTHFTWRLSKCFICNARNLSAEWKINRNSFANAWTRKAITKNDAYLCTVLSNNNWNSVHSFFDYYSFF